MEKNCAAKEKEWEITSKMRSEEMVAIAETIKILNDDDALELFKKTLPGSSSSFLQVQVNAAELRSSALSMVKQMRQTAQVRDRTPQTSSLWLWEARRSASTRY